MQKRYRLHKKNNGVRPFNFARFPPTFYRVSEPAGPLHGVFRRVSFPRLPFLYRTGYFLSAVPRMYTTLLAVHGARFVSTKYKYPTISLYARVRAFGVSLSKDR